MKNAKQMIVIGLTGLVISSVCMIIGFLVGSKFDFWAIMLSWIVFLIIGLSRRKYVTK